MKFSQLALASLAFVFAQGDIQAHCQMPCGIYHDDMVYDQVDQYVETMYKGVSVLKSNKFDDLKERNEFIRWVIQKEKASDEVAALLTQYFLQQKIKVGEPDTQKRLESLHKLLFLAVAIKQTVDLKIVEEFSDEWDKFKLMFHRQGYECDIEKIKLKKDAMKRAALEGNGEHSHDQDHDHGHDHEHSHNDAVKGNDKK